VNVFGAEAIAKERPQDSVTLELRWEEARAECVVMDGQFIVQEGSTARVKQVESLSDGLKAMRKALREQGVLVPVTASSTVLRFTQDYAFDSASTAAGVVAGTGLNGRAYWKVQPDNVPYKEWQETQVSRVAAGAPDAEA
jgi:hypothetical protein